LVRILKALQRAFSFNSSNKKVFNHFSKDFQKSFLERKPSSEKRFIKVCEIHHDFSLVKKSIAFILIILCGNCHHKEISVPLLHFSMCSAVAWLFLQILIRSWWISWLYSAWIDVLSIVLCVNVYLFGCIVLFAYRTTVGSYFCTRVVHLVWWDVAHGIETIL